MTVRLNHNQLSAARTLVRLHNDSRSPFYGLTSLFDANTNAKHNVYYDFGYPAHYHLHFKHFYEFWRRNGLAHGLVEKTADKTWQEHPVLRPENDIAADSEISHDVRGLFRRLRFWQKLRTADARGMVGQYAGLVFQLGDGQPYDQPVRRVPGGTDGVIGVFAAWQEQLVPSEWDTDPKSPTYGQPKMFRYNENSVDPETGKMRTFSVHPDRCYVWSFDGTVFGDSKLEPVYNALMDAEKIRGAGAEGYWKAAKAQPVISAEPDVDFSQLASMLDTDLQGLPDALDEIVSKWSKGFDDSLLLQGMKAEALQISLIHLT